MPQAEHERLRSDLDVALRAALDAAAPGPALERAWISAFGERGYGGAPPVVIAVGKAAAGMAGAVTRLGIASPLAGVVIRPPGVYVPASLYGHNWRLFEADHPLPTQRNLIAARAAADALRLASTRRVPVIALISGGASAHLTLPSAGLSLADIREVTDLLLRSGATIRELNAVRSRCEGLKGGGLARSAAPAPVHAFILSDVPGDPVDVIASGPTVDLPDAESAAIEVLNQRLGGVANDAVERVRRHIAKAVPQAPLRNATNTIIGSNTMSVQAAIDALKRLGYAIAESRTRVEGEAAAQGRAFAARLVELRARSRKAVAIVWGGETTVTVRGDGFGGRNQEAALGAAEVLDGEKGIVAGCLATDGIDGSAPPGASPHAGAIVGGDTASIARERGLDIPAALARNDSFRCCEALGAAITLGPTGTNVNDIWIGLAPSRG